LTNLNNLGRVDTIEMSEKKPLSGVDQVLGETGYPGFAKIGTVAKPIGLDGKMYHDPWHRFI